jgi:hypothetical protein
MGNVFHVGGHAHEHADRAKPVDLIPIAVCQ